MKHLGHISLFFVLLLHISCEKEKVKVDYSGTYCLNFQNMEMVLVQNGNELTFTVQNDLLVNGVGIIQGDTLVLNALTQGSEKFSCTLVFSEDLQSFSGPYSITDGADQLKASGVLVGTKGECESYDIDLYGVPQFMESDFTQVDKIEEISMFRSGFGHSFTDGTESCRNMKHYFTPYQDFRNNNTIEIYAPAKGIITSVSNDGHGASTGLTNKIIQIRPGDQPAFMIQIFHCDLLSAAIETGKKVQAGELLGYARLYYDDLDEYATSFDVAVWVQAVQGMRLISYFDALADEAFEQYISRGVESRSDLIISKEARDADPLQCNGETFLSSGTLDNWFTLNAIQK